MITCVAESPEAPILQLMTNSAKFYYLLLKPPPNSNRVDIDLYKVTAIGWNISLILSKRTIEFMIPSLCGYSQNISLEVIAVDRCGREGPAAVALSQ